MILGQLDTFLVEMVMSACVLVARQKWLRTYCVTDVLEFFKSCYHRADISASQFKSCSLFVACFLFFFLPGVGVAVCLSVRKANHGETAFYRLGAAQLEVGSTCLLRCENPSHRRKQSLRPSSMQIERWPTTCRLLLPIFFHALKQSWSDFSTAQARVG